MTTKTKAKVKVEQERPIKYEADLVDIARGEDALTVGQTKKLLGWQEEDENEQFGDSYHIVDHLGKKVRFTNNVTNRPIYGQILTKLEQEHLRRRWCYNGEPIIVGKTELVLNGQHRLISHVLAEQTRTGPGAEHWADFWSGPITMEALVVYGVDEGDTVVNTMDTCKPRSLSDVIYRSEFFSKSKPKDRKVASRLCDHAIRLLWQRTGAYKGSDAFSIRRTHAESTDFLSRHKSILKCIKHIMAENAERAITRWITPGYAAALMYLMAASNTDGDTYHNSQTPGEVGKGKVIFDQWEKAEEFWSLLGSGAAVIQEVRNALARLGTQDGGQAGGSLKEKIGVIAKAWALWKAGEVIKSSSLNLKYTTDSNGVRQLNEWPEFGGIDAGERKEDDKPTTTAQGEDITSEPDTNGPVGDDPSPEDLAAIKEERRKKLIQEAAQRRAARKAEEGGQGSLDKVAARANGEQTEDTE